MYFEKYIFMGDAVLQKKYTTETLPFTRKRNRGEKTQYYVENSNVPIIPKEIFNAVKLLQNDRKKSSYNRQVSLLSGKVKCADCGKNFRKLTDKEKIYWVCSYRTTSRSECNTGRIPEADFYDTEDIESIENQLIEIINKKHSLQAEVEEIKTERTKRENAQSRLEQIYLILDGLKNHPMTYNDTLVRQILDTVVVESKDKIKVVFTGGYEAEQELG